jgi:polyisoprenoid-binding protein YceI
MTKSLVAAAALLSLVACAPGTTVKTAQTAPAAAKPAPITAPAGAYTLDKSHAALVFKLSHMGFSNYTAGFADFDAQMTFDPAGPETSTIAVTIDPRSLTLPHPPAGFQAELTGAQWLDAKQYPAITFKSTKVQVTGARTANITGDLSLHGVTKPVVLQVTFNGGYAGFAMDPHARIGFSATGTFNRSDFGMAYGVPAPGTTMGVGDTVSVEIEAEFSGPPLAGVPVPARP